VRNITDRTEYYRSKAAMCRVIASLVLKIARRLPPPMIGERQQIHNGWKQRLERAEYQIARTSRRYEATDPDHRPVARTLEAEEPEIL
jgi:hypothetical protein